MIPKLAMIVLIVAAISFPTYAAFGDHTPLHNLQQVIINIMNTLTNHEERIMSLEEKTSVAVSGNEELSIQSTCPILNTGGGDEPEIVQGWCPDGSHKLYLITDLRVTPLALIILNVHDGEITNPGCSVVQTGTIVIESGVFPNSFVIRCDNTNSDLVMKYSVFV